jgi:hypothetical protein
MNSGEVFVLIMCVAVIGVLAYLDLKARRNRRTLEKD